MSKNGTSVDLNPIPESFRKLWGVWDLRVCIILSLGLQTFLILFASLRKRSSSRISIALIWSAYLLADWVAAFVLGLISNSNTDNASSSAKTKTDLLAFWAPFLLLHLGGPDTITAFALEDNELWVRHLLGLVFQFAAAGYIFFQTLPGNELWVATLLMFLAGLIKYAERTRSLYLASLGRFRDSLLTDPDPGPNYAKLMAEYSSMEEANLPAKIDKITEPETKYQSSNDHQITMQAIDTREKVQRAYEFFQTFKGLIVDMIFSFQDRSKSREFFLKRNTEDAFEVIEIELSFIYEVLYTKAVVVHSLFGYFFRIVAFSATLVALLLFLSYNYKHDLPKFDVIITYMLLIGAIILDIISLLKLIFSDWTIATQKGSRMNSVISAIVTRAPIPRTSRWSESMSQLNLISYTLSNRTNTVDRVVHYFGLKDFLDEMQYTSCASVTKELKEFIFSELKKKSNIAKDPKSAKEISSARGDWVLGHSMYHKSLGWSVEVDYDESLLLWHIATEIVYQRNETDETNRDACKLSKLLSDYMLYLLVMQPTMMLGVGGIGRIRFLDTCAEARIFYRGLERKEFKDTCDKLINVNTVIKPADVKGDRSKSVLFDAVILAKRLEVVAKEKRWELISHVWLELLCYAAIQCRANSHAQQLSKGGQLLTFVWLLMTHLGLGEQFRIEKGHARTKLIVEK